MAATARQGKAQVGGVSAADDPTYAPARVLGTRVSRRDALVGLGLAVGIAGGAWAIGGRAGFDEIGRGGVNQRLLPKVGERAPDFMALSDTETPVWLHDFAGRPVWLSFWASWCAPCRAEMPELEAANRRLAPQGVVLMSVSLDDRYDQAVEFAHRYGATFPVLNVPQRFLIDDTYPVNNFPTHLFIAPDGTIRRIIAGPLDEATAVAEGEALLA